MSRLGRRRMALVLALVVAGCATALYAELQARAEGAQAAAPPPVEPAALALPSIEEPAVAVPPLAAYAAVVERPLFSPTRRPPVVAAPDEAAPPARRDELTLRGVMLAPHKRVALIEIEGADEEARWLAEGETLQGWTIAAVRERHVVLSEHGETRELALDWEPSAEVASRSEPRTPAVAPPAVMPAMDPHLAKAILMLKTPPPGARPARRR